MSAPVELAVEAVLTSAKYRQVMPDFVRRLAGQELARGRSLKETVKAVKNKLHQVGAAYSGPAPGYTEWLEELAAAGSADGAAFKALCREFMAAHASTHERLPILDAIYGEPLADLAPLHSVLDLACGLNPLSAPWMPLASGAAYHACDIYLDQVAFLQGYLSLAGLSGHVFACDLTAGTPDIQVELVLLMKALPCLEQVDRRLGAGLLASLPARHALVSFPARSLGGRSRQMEINYPAHFNELTAGQGWAVRRFDFPGEIVFRLDRTGDPSHG